VKILRTIGLTLRSLWRRRAVRREVDEELRFHIEQRTAENLAAGMAPEEAERVARKRFGNFQNIREECRDTRCASVGEAMLQDLRFGLRMLRKNPGFTTVAVLTLALGIGANTAIFSVVNTVLLRPLPYEQPDQLVVVAESNPRLGWQNYTVSLANYLDWREHNTVFREMAAAATAAVGTLNGGQGAEQVRTAFVSASLFPLLGVKPLLGRPFLPEEQQRGRTDVVLIGERLWRDRFNADPKIITRAVQLDGRDFTVVGVMPAGLKLFEPSRVQGWEAGVAQADVWRPLVIWPEKLKWRNMREFLVLGRLRSGVSVLEAQSQMTGIARQLEQQFPDANGGWSATVAPWQQEVTSRANPLLLLLLGASGLALLVAIANLGNLTLARFTARQREFAVRAALGAGRLRLVRQLLTESLLLSGIGGVAGLLLALWGLNLLRGFLPAGLPRAEEIDLDSRVLAFTAAISALTGISFGLISLRRFLRTEGTGSIRSEGGNYGGTPARTRLRGCLVVSEVALVTLLLVGTGLLTRSFWRMSQVDPGFNPQNVVAVDVSLGGRTYTNGEAMVGFVERLLPRLATLPGAQIAATVNGLPLDPARENMDIEFAVEGHPSPALGDRLITGLRQASPAYFKTMEIPVVQGRSFTEHDNLAGPEVAIVNEQFARSFFPGEQPLGKRISSPDFGSAPCEIVGVVRDVKHAGLTAPVPPEVFRPHLQSCFTLMTVVVRTASAPGEMAAAVRRAVAEVDHNVAVSNVRTLSQQVVVAGSAQRFAVVLMGLFAGLALALGTVGIYGVVSSIVDERTRELGIRLALGAQRGDVLRLVVLQGLRLAVVGIFIGVLGALAVTRLLRSLLFGVSPTDLATFVAIPALLLAVAWFACWLPARRAARVDPTVALRYE
jgi:putative ABC transport system permease protein